MARQVWTARDCVLRALAATEIAESCTDPKLRASFFALGELWLGRAERARSPRSGERAQLQ